MATTVSKNKSSVMKKKRALYSLMFVVTSGLSLFGFQNCSPQTHFAEFDEVVSSSMGGDSNGSGTNIQQTISFNHHISFEVNAHNNPKVDILFVVDNSGSMREEQAKIAEAFSGFIAQIAHMDWRIAITTTDNSKAGECNKGNLCSMLPSQYYVDKTTPFVNDIFIQKIQQGTSGSATEVGLSVILAFLEGKRADYQSFIRPDASFVSIVVSDEDESSSLTAASFVDRMDKQLAPQGKKGVVHSSIYIPGSSCPSGATQGRTYNEASVLTGGIVASICDNHYGNQFKFFADSIIGQVNQKTLSCAPADNDKDGKPDVVVIGPDGFVTQFTLSGNAIKFNPILEKAGQYQIRYSCK